MKKIIFISLVVAISIPMLALFEFNPENPANIARRDYTQIVFPGLTYNFNFNNSLLKFNDISMFEEGNVLTNSDKELLTSENIRLFGSFNTTLLEAGYQNWNLSIKAIGFFDAEVLDKKYSEIVFYGNQVDENYETNVGKGSEGFAMWKTAITYAYPRDLNPGMIPGLFSKESEGIIAEIRDMPINLGARFNINHSLAYGGIVESSQQFGSVPDSTYYDIYAKYAYSDGDTKGMTSASLGFGLITEFMGATFHLSLDDIFLKLSYDDLAGGEVSQVGTDSLLYFQEDHEIYEYENIDNDSLRLGSRTRSISPSFSMALEYTFLEKIDAVIKYSSSELSNQDGFLLGGSYELGVLPLQAFYGNNGSSYYQFISGLKFDNFEWKMGATFYHGFFGYAKGIGLHSGMVFRF
ncbi:MAG: hypothetical protein K9N39_11020 [Candidatus Cloacimonetes bacterium]|nr:hypothetical protein [Candidatus Cloacimonadota bacterium]MCF7814922.1 hypothetical protein [Candidatus Cloacimonadota bacterium]